MGKAFPGIEATVVDLKTHEVIKKPGTVGLIAIKPGWPSMFRTYWNNKKTYERISLSENQTGQKSSCQTKEAEESDRAYQKVN